MGFKEMKREQMNIVIVGHVDHGKSTVIGRLLADTNSLPEGKLEAIQKKCKNESKQFEYAFLLDALKDEQSQGITIDSARCFFNTKKRDYIIIDAPGHIEFLKNMISGAARAEAALLVIDAKEGIKENSKRHGYMLSLLGVNQIIVLINKMDLVDYSETRYNELVKEYNEFLEEINIEPKEFIPISAMNGDNIYQNTENLKWFKGNTTLEALDSFSKKKKEDKPFRMYVQDIYRFTDSDERRIVAGKINSGNISEGDEIVFLPSNKKSKIKSIIGHNSEGYSTGFTLTEELYIKRGEIMCKEPLPNVSSKIKVSLFWMGLKPLLLNKKYKFKIGTNSSSMKVEKIQKVLNASNLEHEKKKQVERHEVAEIIISLRDPIAFDTIDSIQETGRFVIVDDYEIAGGGIITEALDDNLDEARESTYVRDSKWDASLISKDERNKRYNQESCFVLITGNGKINKKDVAKNLELKLFNEGKKTYFLGIRNILRGLDLDIETKDNEEHIRRFAEVANILVDSGQIVFGTASNLSNESLALIKTLVSKVLIVSTEKNSTSDLALTSENLDQNIQDIYNKLQFEGIILDDNME